MRVELTQDDIENGTPNVCDDCPLARAATRALKALYDVPAEAKVSVRYVLLGAELKLDRYIQFSLANVSQSFARTWKSEELYLFARNFDDGQTVEPLSFDLDIEELWMPWLVRKTA